MGAHRAMEGLLAAAERIERLSGIGAIWAETLSALKAVGIDYVIYLTTGPDDAAPHLLTTIPEIYGATPPAADPFLHYCCDSFALTRTGPEFLTEHDYLPPDVRAFIANAARSGFISGLGVPVRLSGSARYGGFNLGTGLGREAFLREIEPHGEALRTFCLLVHRRIEEVAHPEAGIAAEALARLTPRERELILLVAEGHSRKECARRCGISPHTAAEYIQSAYRKLGVANRVEAARLLAGTNGAQGPG